MIYSGSQVTKGRARTVCVATGMKSELGKIQEAMTRKTKNNKTGFKKQWHKFKVFLGVAETTPLQIKYAISQLFQPLGLLTLQSDDAN